MVDISNLTYKELIALENEITERKKDLQNAEFKGLVHGVINAITAIINKGYNNKYAFWDDEGQSWSWSDVRWAIEAELKQKEEEEEEDY